MSVEAGDGAAVAIEMDTVDVESLDLARPWPRLWARSFDVLVYALPVGMIIGMLFPQLFYYEIFQGPFGDLAAGIVVLPVIMVIDAVIISLTGTSPGKAIAGLRVVTMEARKPSMETSLMRNIRCYFQGLAAGIPLANFITYVLSYQRVREQDTAWWDDATDTRVMSVANDGTRTWAIAICFILLNAAFRFFL